MAEFNVLVNFPVVAQTQDDARAALKPYLDGLRVQSAIVDEEAYISNLKRHIHNLRLALVSAEYAIKGREHTGFITKALTATESVGL